MVVSESRELREQRSDGGAQLPARVARRSDGLAGRDEVVRETSGGRRRVVPEHRPGAPDPSHAAFAKEVRRNRCLLERALQASERGGDGGLVVSSTGRGAQ